MQTLGGKTVDQLAIPDLENPYRKWQPTNEQVLEELSLIAGPPAVDAEGNRIIGGALKEIDDTHAVLSEMPTLGFFRRNFITGRQDNPEYKKRNLEIDRRYLAERALYLLGYEPRGFRGKEITDAHLTTQIDRAFSLDNE